MGRIRADFTLGTQPTDDMPCIFEFTVVYSATTYRGRIASKEVT